MRPGNAHGPQHAEDRVRVDQARLGLMQLGAGFLVRKLGSAQA